MKREQVIELVRESGFSVYAKDGEFSIAVMAGCGAEVCTDEVMNLITLVEQAALERAAQVCERDVARMTNDLHGTTFYIATGQCAQAIRALSKEQQ